MATDFNTKLPRMSRKAAAPEFQIERKVATGGMGAIYQALDVRMQRRVAMKVLRPDRMHNRDHVLRFVREARITARLQHPNIVPVHYFGEDEDRMPFYIMKLVRGESLEALMERIRRGEPSAIQQYPLAKLLAVFLQVCNAVGYAHAKDIIHRDIKPDNIMLGDFGEVLLMDWGLAKEIGWRNDTATLTEVELIAAEALDALDDEEDDGEERDETPTQAGEFTDVHATARDDSYETLHTMPGMILGSPSYMAPEQVAGRVEDVDARTDIYGLGGLLYCMLTLYPPHAGATVEQTRELHVSGEITPPSAYNPSLKVRVKGLLLGKKDGAEFELPHCPGGLIPEALSDICMRALQKRPEDRHVSVREMQDEIIAVIQQGRLKTDH